MKTIRGWLILTLVLAAASAWFANKISYQVRTDLGAGTDIATVAQQWSRDLTRPLHISLDSFDLLMACCAAALVVLIIAYQASMRRNTREGEEHGSARWGTAADIKPFVHSNKRENLLFTRTERLSLDSRKTQRNLHALVIGSSGSGKTRYYVQPNLAQANQSYIVTDPNGDIMRNTAGALQNEGYEIRCLNFVDWAKSDTFNPLAYFTPAQAEVDALMLVQNIISNTTGKAPAGNDGFWEKAERALLTALVAYVYGSKGSSGTLNDVTALLGELQTSEDDETFTSAGDELFLALGDIVAAHAESATDTANYDDDALTALRMWQFGFSQYDIYSKGAGETKKSVLISLGVRLAPLYMQPLQRVLSSDTIDAAAVGQRKTALYLVVPDSHSTFAWLVAVFYDLMFQKNIALADASPGGRLPVDVHCFMDEFANIGKLPSFHTKIAVMRKRGIATSVIIQNYEQGKSLYKDDWETVVGNCDSVLFLGGAEKSTVDWLAKRLGKETIQSREDSRQMGQRGSVSQSHRKLARELLTADEIAQLPGDDCLYFLRGVPAFRSRKLAPIATGDFEYTPATNASPQATVAEPEPEPFDDADVRVERGPVIVA